MGGPALAAVAVVGTVVKGIGQINEGKAKRNLYYAKAEEAKIQGRREAVEYKEQGVEVLRERNRLMASAMAKGGAGGYNFAEAGSPVDVIQKGIRYDSTKDFTVARDNATIALQMANYQAENYRRAGKAAERAGKVAALGSVFEGVVSAGSVYGTKGFTSDRRLKEDIVKVGVDTRTNLNLYEFSYLGNASRYVGVMADEVEVFYPNAVFYGKHFYKAVNYKLLGIDFRKVA